MKYWTHRRIMFSALMLYSVLCAFGWALGHVDVFLEDKQPIMDNYFRLTTITEDGSIIINQTILGSFVIALAWALVLMIWASNWPMRNKMIVMIITMALANMFLWGTFDHVLARTMAKVLVFPPIVWVPFAVAITMTFLMEMAPIKKIVFFGLLASLVLGDLTHGWFGHICNVALMAVLSAVLWAISFLCFRLWILILTLGAMLFKFVPWLLGTAVPEVLSWILVGIAWIILFLVAVAAIILVAGMFCGKTPKDIFRETCQGLLCICGHDDEYHDY